MIDVTKIGNNTPLSFDDGVALFQEYDVQQVGVWADRQRQHRHGKKAYYIVNAHINPTNICQLGCPLCAYACRVAEERAYVMSVDEVLQHVQSAVDSGVTHLHLVSAIHPDKPYSWYRDLVATVHSAFPSLTLRAWTAVEIAHFAKIAEKTVEAVLREMQELGVSSMPGGGAEIFEPKIRRMIAPAKISAEEWLDVHRIAHRIGMNTNATMLFGHLESFEDRVRHLLLLRDLQEESLQNGSGRFDSFVPLLFHPKETALESTLGEKRLSPQEILKTVAVSRLMLHNFEHIKAYWVTLGESLAQIALSFGADDFDGTIFEESIHHEAGSTTPRGLSESRLRQLILDSHHEPVRKFG